MIEDKVLDAIREANEPDYDALYEAEKDRRMGL
jgi:hypothetical protein